VAAELRYRSRRSAKTPTVARHGRLKRSSAWKTVAKVTASALAVVLVSGASIAAYAAWDLAGSVQPGVDLGNEKVLEGVPDVGAMPGGVNLLLIGSDSRANQGDGYGEYEEGTLNDVTMLLHIAEDHSHAEVVSFPRDMYVSVPECVDPADPQGEPLSAMSSVKINTTLQHGGMACVVRTVEELTGLSIPFAGVVQFNGVANLADAVGGVEVCVASRIEDDHTDTYLDPGMHTLSGLEALQFLRTRHGVGDGSDLGRISNQQIYMSALARNLQSEGTLSDPVKLYSIAKVALENMELSNSLHDPVRMVSIARALQDTDLSNIAFVQYPTAYSDDYTGVYPTASAEAVNVALQNDIALEFDPAAQKNLAENGFGSIADPNAPVEPAPAPEETTPAEEPPATDAPATDEPTATPGPVTEVLPEDVPGQTADQSRCAAGRGFDEQ
jgi:LCP family protein required for cell wall assembly